MHTINRYLWTFPIWMISRQSNVINKTNDNNCMFSLFTSLQISHLIFLILTSESRVVMAVVPPTYKCFILSWSAKFTYEHVGAFTGYCYSYSMIRKELTNEKINLVYSNETCHFPDIFRHEPNITQIISSLQLFPIILIWDLLTQRYYHEITTLPPIRH
jgi:hypothetical protein